MLALEGSTRKLFSVCVHALRQVPSSPIVRQSHHPVGSEDWVMSSSVSICQLLTVPANTSDALCGLKQQQDGWGSDVNTLQKNIMITFVYINKQKIS